MVSPRRAACRSAAFTPSRQAALPHPWWAVSSTEVSVMLWCTAAISAPPNPASAIWSISRAISTGSTRPSGHHQRNLGRTSLAGWANQLAVGAAAVEPDVPEDAALAAGPSAVRTPVVRPAASTDRRVAPPRCGWVSCMVQPQLVTGERVLNRFNQCRCGNFNLPFELRSIGTTTIQGTEKRDEFGSDSLLDEMAGRTGRRTGAGRCPPGGPGMSYRRPLRQAGARRRSLVCRKPREPSVSGAARNRILLTSSPSR